MKKQYINPTMEVVEMKMHSQLMAGSKNASVSESEQSNESALGREYEWDE